jgi:hypothetical protein
LHGDDEPAAKVFDAWAPAAEARGFAVFAPTCPVAAGCTRHSWWKWNGNPTWLELQIDALSGHHPIDPERMWIVGWSGGGSYIGHRTYDIERTFAAIVIHGGGIPPTTGPDAGFEEVPLCAETPAPVYFLVGDANPLHLLAKNLRAYYDTCKHDVTWNVLRGADHAGEWRALASHRGAILDWLSGKRLAHAGAVPAAAPPNAAAVFGAPPATAVTPTPRPSDATAPAPPAAAQVGHGACACSTPRGHAAPGLAASALALALVVALRARRRLAAARR